MVANRYFKRGFIHASNDTVLDISCLLFSNPGNSNSHGRAKRYDVEIQVCTRPLRHAAVPDKNEAFCADKMYLTICVEWVSDHFVWSWFDVTLSTFDEDMHKKRFLHFRS